MENNVQSIYDFVVEDAQGKTVTLSDYKGRVVLIVNVASRCGYTPQYTGLEELYQKYKDRGFIILGFPSNDFLGQEPGTNADIQTFCTTKYHVTFPVFAKVKVRGANGIPLYKYLVDKKANHKAGGAVKWNFNKFLIGKNGIPIAHYESKFTPMGEEMLKSVEAALSE